MPNRADLFRTRVLLAVHVVGWCVVVLPPSVSIRAAVGATIGTAALALLPVDGWPDPLRLAARLYAGASGAATVAVLAGLAVEAPEAVAVGAGGAVALAACHLAAGAALRQQGVALADALRRPWRRAADDLWPSLLRRTVVADAGLMLGAAATGVAPMTGGLLVAAIAVTGWVVAVGGLGAALLDLGAAAPSLLAPLAGTDEPGPPVEHGERDPAKMQG